MARRKYWLALPSPLCCVTARPGAALQQIARSHQWPVLSVSPEMRFSLAASVGSASNARGATTVMAGKAVGSADRGPVGRRSGVVSPDRRFHRFACHHRRRAPGIGAEPTDAASEKRISGETLNTRPLVRPGDLLEAAPGLAVTQHSGEGKANQYFLRGMNLDHAPTSPSGSTACLSTCAPTATARAMPTSTS